MVFNRSESNSQIKKVFQLECFISCSIQISVFYGWENWGPGRGEVLSKSLYELVRAGTRPRISSGPQLTSLSTSSAGAGEINPKIFPSCSWVKDPKTNPVMVIGINSNDGAHYSTDSWQPLWSDPNVNAILKMRNLRIETHGWLVWNMKYMQALLTTCFLFLKDLLRHL